MSSLPCYPCPHNASCCAYGTQLTETEAETLTREHGAGVVYRTHWGEWRTRVRAKRCVLYRDGGCSIHSTSYYPAMCRSFPFTDPNTGGPYEYDTDICGTLAEQPELIHLLRADVARR